MIKAIITDFDGTLVDTFEANLRAYQKAFEMVGLTITIDQYRECFGYRFEQFMSTMGITDEQVANTIKEAKKDYYPEFFQYLRLNKTLVEMIRCLQHMGGKTAIASTASKDNLMNAVNHLDISGIFDLIYAGVDVKEGKPSPEIYINAMETLGVKPKQTLIFEDSEVGIKAAKASGAYYIIVSPNQFE